MRPATTTLLAKLDARDRALFTRCALTASTTRLWRRVWTTLTHVGGATVTIAAATVPLLLGGEAAAAGRQALLTLFYSHLLVQLVKRTVGRPRPSRGVACATLVGEPDRFSFPSGHSAAAMSVALSFAMAYPPLAVPLLVLALLVGLSRVFLGVHYPGDVFAGQLLAVLTYYVVLPG